SPMKSSTRHKGGTPAKTKPANSVNAEIATDFIPVIYGGAANLAEGGRMVRVELPRSAMASFGLPVHIDRVNEKVKADVLLGVDGNTFTFVNSEFSFDKLVKGAPYSAQAVTEMTQILSDGNRIVNTSSAAVYRDGQGRTRREQTLKAIGNFSAHGEPFQTISI